MSNSVTIPAHGKETFYLSGNTASRRFNRDGTVVLVNDSILVVKFKGYSENPGSRFSGLKTYYPAETVVYAIIDRDGSRVNTRVLGAWDTRKK